MYKRISLFWHRLLDENHRGRMTVVVSVVLTIIAGLWHAYKDYEEENQTTRRAIPEALEPSNNVKPEDFEIGRISPGPLSLVHMNSSHDDAGYPILHFTVRNSSPEPSLINSLDVEIQRYMAAGKLPESRSRPLEPIATWDLLLPPKDHPWSSPPKGESTALEGKFWGQLNLKPKTPIVVAANDYARISIRLATMENGLHKLPNLPYWLVLKFSSDQGFVAISNKIDLSDLILKY